MYKREGMVGKQVKKLCGGCSELYKEKCGGGPYVELCVTCHVRPSNVKKILNRWQPERCVCLGALLWQSQGRYRLNSTSIKQWWCQELCLQHHFQLTQLRMILDTFPLGSLQAMPGRRLSWSQPMTSSIYTSKGNQEDLGTSCLKTKDKAPPFSLEQRPSTPPPAALWSSESVKGSSIE